MISTSNIARNTQFINQLWMCEKPMDGLEEPPYDAVYTSLIPFKHCLKPKEAFWTSTAIKNGNAYTSKWVEWVKEETPTWFSPIGYLFKVSTTDAKILRVETDADVERIFANYSKVKLSSDKKYSLFENFPWKNISKDYNGIHYDPKDHYENKFLYHWDVESTVWFDVNVLKFEKKVVIV